MSGVLSKWLGYQAIRKNYEIIALMIPVGTACTFAVYKMYDKMSSDQDLRIRADRGELNDWESERIDPSKAEQVKKAGVWKMRGV